MSEVSYRNDSGSAAANYERFFVRAIFSMPDPAGIGELLENAGFEDVSAAEEVAVLALPQPAEFLWQYISLTPLGPSVAEASAEAQQAVATGARA